VVNSQRFVVDFPEFTGAKKFQCRARNIHHVIRYRADGSSRSRLPPGIARTARDNSDGCSVIRDSTFALHSTRAESSVVMAGHSRPKDGVASLAYLPAIHALLCSQGLDARDKRGHDGERPV
jgi:hypothetical protein